MQGQNISILALLNNAVVTPKGLKIGFVKDLISTPTGDLLYIIVATSDSFGRNIYYAIPFQLFKVLPPKMEQVIFQWDKDIAASFEAFNKCLLPGFYADIPIYDIQSFVQLLHQHLNQTQGHRTDQDNY